MAISLRTRLGIVIAIAGIVGFVWAQQSLAECQTILGQAGQAVSEQAQQRCQTRRGIRVLSIIAIGIGGGATVLGGLNGSTSESEADTTIESVESKEHFTISPTEFSYVEVSTTDEAKLHYSVDVLNGPGVNVIVTYAKNLNEFRNSTNIGWVKKASAVNVESIEKEAILRPGDYVIILDNTGRFGEQEATDEADVTIDYNIYK